MLFFFCLFVCLGFFFWGGGFQQYTFFLCNCIYCTEMKEILRGEMKLDIFKKVFYVWLVQNSHDLID